MTALDTIRAAIVAVLSPIAAPGIVHPFERYAAKTEAMRALYQPGGVGGVVNGWNVRRGAIRRRLLPSGRLLVAAEWLISGYRSLVDGEESELVMDATAEALIGALDADPTLGGAVRGVPAEDAGSQAAGPQLVDSEPVMFAGVLCHRARISLVTEHFEAAAIDSGGLADLIDPEFALITATVERLSGLEPFGTIEGRLAYDRDDDPAALPAALVMPLFERTAIDSTTLTYRDRVELGVGIVIVAPSAYPAGEGAAAADGLASLRAAVRGRLHGWGDDAGAPVEIPFTYRGAEPLPAPAGRVAWREIYAPSIFVEA